MTHCFRALVYRFPFSLVISVVYCVVFAGDEKQGRGGEHEVKHVLVIAVVFVDVVALALVHVFHGLSVQRNVFRLVVLVFVSCLVARDTT